MISLLNNEVFGLITSIVFYSVFLKLSKKIKNPLLNPLLMSIFGIILFLEVSKIPIEYYELGGHYIKFFLAPATIVLAIPLYKQLHLLKKHLFPILFGTLIGCITALISVYFLSKLFGLDKELIISLLPKSITTPIGISISETYGGIVSLTVASIIITGITGSVISPFVTKYVRLKSDIAKGIAIGTSSHAVGTSKALEMGETIGAMSGLAIALAGTITALIMPIFYKMFLKF